MTSPAPSPGTGAPAFRGLAAKRAAILEAALRVFVTQGYAAASIDDIAAHAGASRQTVYNHFRDKETLFLAAVDDAVQAQLAELRAAAEPAPDLTGDVGAWLTELGRRILAAFQRPEAAELRLLIQSEAPRHPALKDLWQARSRTPVWSPLIGHLARLALAGRLHVDDPARSAGQYVTLVTASGWQMTELGTFTLDDLHPEDTDATLRANVDLFVRAHTPA